MANFSLTASGTLTGLPAGSDTISFSYSNSSSPGLLDLVTTGVAGTGTELTIPSGALFALVVPPAANTTAIRISGTGGGATGATIHVTNPTLISLASSAAELNIRTAAAITNIQVYWL